MDSLSDELAGLIPECRKTLVEHDGSPTVFATELQDKECWYPLPKPIDFDGGLVSYLDSGTVIVKQAKHHFIKSTGLVPKSITDSSGLAIYEGGTCLVPVENRQTRFGLLVVAMASDATRSFRAWKAFAKQLVAICETHPESGIEDHRRLRASLHEWDQLGAKAYLKQTITLRASQTELTDFAIGLVLRSTLNTNHMIQIGHVFRLDNLWSATLFTLANWQGSLSPTLQRIESPTQTPGRPRKVRKEAERDEFLIEQVSLIGTPKLAAEKVAEIENRDQSEVYREITKALDWGRKQVPPIRPGKKP